MPYYDDLPGRRKPPRPASPGPEDGYRPRGKKANGPAKPPLWDNKPRFSEDKPRFHDDKPRRRDDGLRFRDDGPRFHDDKPRLRDDGPRRREGPPPPGRPERRTPPPPARPPRPAPPPFDGEAPLPRENLLAGRNPIREALKSGRDIERLLVARGDLSGSAREIVAMARERHIVVQRVDRARLDELSPTHQGMIAFASAFRYAQVEDMFALARARGEDVLLVILDGVTDPHNLGAIIRSAECAGAHGVIIPERRAVGLTPAAVRASAGAVEHLPVARVTNLARLMETLQQQGVWVAAADMQGENYLEVDLTGPLALVVGAEGEGVSRLVLERSDRRIALPLAGKIDSLNASVAAGILLYEVRRQRGWR